MRMSGMLAAALAMLAGCGERDAAQQPAPMSRGMDPAPLPIARPSRAPAATPRPCAAELGAEAAAQRVAVCRSVSPATHPPCNAANSCAMIGDEIARSCALFAGAANAGDMPMPGCATDPMGAEAAADVIRRYYSAIDAHDYAAAWMQWGDDGRPGQTFAAFRRGFADTRRVRVTIGTMPPAEGAAGSIYQTVPVRIDSTLADGRRQRFAGSYVVRRVNDVDGATSAQRRWHIDSASLKAWAASQPDRITPPPAPPSG